MKMDRLAVIIATRGRPAIVADLVERLAHQTRPADRIVVVGAREEDIAALDGARRGLTALVGRQGSALQRNDGLAIVRAEADWIVFFDDDFLPSRCWLQNAVETFTRNPDLAGLTGTVLADGIHNGGIAAKEAEAIVTARDENPPQSIGIHHGVGPYGCNMAFRASAIAGLTFDERLPLYAWLEDSDFGGQIARSGGKTARADALWGVHLGHRIGRERGERLGYSQVANPLYLAAKGTLPRHFLLKQMLRNVTANFVRSIKPEPFADRRGRLKGNLVALADLMRGRLAPERVLQL